MVQTRDNRTYSQVLDQAINDMTTNGYDSAERVAYWSTQLRLAAERVMKSSAQVEQAVRDGLEQVYRRMIERGEIAKYHPGVGRFTLEKLRPELRNELSKSIMASANLIKLNKERRQAETLQRFQGWATSIPKGGSRSTNKREEKENLRKPIAQIKFEQKRVEIDQAHKLISSLNGIIAKSGGAIAAKWVSHWRQPNYDFDEAHKERAYDPTGNVYLLRSSWALDQGLIKPMRGVGYADQFDQPAERPFCRCYWVFVYNLRDLPEEMLTALGKKTLAAVQARIKNKFAIV